MRGPPTLILAIWPMAWLQPDGDHLEQVDDILTHNLVFGPPGHARHGSSGPGRRMPGSLGAFPGSFGSSFPLALRRAFVGHARHYGGKRPFSGGQGGGGGAVLF